MQLLLCHVQCMQNAAEMVTLFWIIECGGGDTPVSLRQIPFKSYPQTVPQQESWLMPEIALFQHFIGIQILFNDLAPWVQCCMNLGSISLNCCSCLASSSINDSLDSLDSPEALLLLRLGQHWPVAKVGRISLYLGMNTIAILGLFKGRAALWYK